MEVGRLHWRLPIGVARQVIKLFTMVSVLIEEVGDDGPIRTYVLEKSNTVSYEEPSDVLEHDDPVSLMYLLDVENDDVDDVFDNLVDDDMFATTMGQRLLAMQGHDVEDSTLSLREFLLGRPTPSLMREFTEQHPRRFTMYSRSGMPLPLPQLRDWELDAPSHMRSVYHVLPGGYVQVVASGNDEEDDDEDEEDDALELADDEDYMDWLGQQLLKRRRGEPSWVIADVEDGDTSDLAYTLLEAGTYMLSN